MNGRVLIIAGSDSGGGAGILTAIEHPPVITKILTHLGLPAAPIPRASRARSPMPSTSWLKE
ncbi:MAG: hypothetical protein M3461_04885 [Pseudomonadota bacterium]|nr:hypothetical protein [Pseudomonadota bacterium]